MLFRYARPQHARPFELLLVAFVWFLAILLIGALWHLEDLRVVEQLQIRLPDIRQAQCVENPDPMRLVISVTQDGGAIINMERRSDKEVMQALAFESALGKSGSGPSNGLVFINADERVPFKHVRKILQACADPRIRIWRIEFGTRPGQPGETVGTEEAETQSHE